MKLLLGVSLVIASPAHAEDALHARARAEAGKTWLEVDRFTHPVFAPQLEGLVGEHRLTRADYQLDRATSLRLELDEHDNTGGITADKDVRSQGWKASARLVRDFGFATVTLSAELGDVDTQLGRGRYRDLGVSVMRILHRTGLSRSSIKRAGGKKAWFGLSFGQRKWLLDEDQVKPPGAERDGWQALFVVGWNF